MFYIEIKTIILMDWTDVNWSIVLENKYSHDGNNIPDLCH